MPDDPQELLEAAHDVMRNAHAPYSELRVGAALRDAFTIADAPAAGGGPELLEILR